MNNPNATVAAFSGSLGIIVVWALGHFGVDVSAELGGAITTGLAAIVLFVGRRGIKGVLSAIWNGSEKVRKP